MKPSSVEFNEVVELLQVKIGTARVAFEDAVINALEEIAPRIANWPDLDLARLSRRLHGFCITENLVRKAARFGSGELGRHLFRAPKVKLDVFDVLPAAVQQRLNDPEGKHTVRVENRHETYPSREINTIWESLVGGVKGHAKGKNGSSFVTMLALVDTNKIDDKIVLLLQTGTKKFKCYTTAEELLAIVGKYVK